ncbi:unnamed protein product [Cylindrotheca closterium]|uniref:DUF6824 domain-containing protein n=1 Tax=Cylindrotheca closterium TaxID=2856 RepID=A0AAD2FSB8_9STRA|nr:unnamed protein product [Cylindrotheca closterium]
MESKSPPTQEVSAETPSQSSSILPPAHEAGDNATPADVTTIKKEDKQISSDTNGVESNTTNASKDAVVPVSGSPRDILCGRGLHIMNHHGNLNLHLIVDQYRQAYLSSTRREKAAITRNIVQQLKSTGARFLRRFDDESDDKWVEVDDDTAYKKVSHALRLRKSLLLKTSDHSGQNFLQPLPGQQAKSSTSQHFAAMPIGPQNTISHLSSSLPASTALAMHQLPFASPAYQRLQFATRPALPLGVGTRHAQSLLHTAAYGNAGIDPRLYGDSYSVTLESMAQLQNRHRPSFNGSLIEGQSSKKSSHEEK